MQEYIVSWMKWILIFPFSQALIFACLLPYTEGGGL